jgi:hypothetical protein
MVMKGKDYNMRYWGEEKGDKKQWGRREERREKG